MKIKTITCHEVYNYGATLQEYALITYLESIEHEVEAIQYKPDYLSKHFKLWEVSNPRYEKNPVLKAAYLIFKLPKRLTILPRKWNFDKFSAKHIKRTKKRYETNEDLKNDLPEADAFVCGSDQIWNSFFQNGKDPAFYLDFVPSSKLKVSYAASFATEELEEKNKSFVKRMVEGIDKVSVRETSGISILEDLGVKDVVQVLDPVFLLDKSFWVDKFVDKKEEQEFIFVYDFDSNKEIERVANSLAKEKSLKIYTVNRNINYADKNFCLEGPDKFLALIYKATFVLTNSFHAVAFSLIFKKNFLVFNRSEKINTRMRDLLGLVGCLKLLEGDLNFDYANIHELPFEEIEDKLNEKIKFSKTFLNEVFNQ